MLRTVHARTMIIFFKDLFQFQRERLLFSLESPLPFPLHSLPTPISDLLPCLYLPQCSFLAYFYAFLAFFWPFSSKSKEARSQSFRWSLLCTVTMDKSLIPQQSSLAKIDGEQPVHDAACVPMSTGESHAPDPFHLKHGCFGRFLEYTLHPAIGSFPLQFYPSHSSAHPLACAIHMQGVFAPSLVRQLCKPPLPLPFSFWIDLTDFFWWLQSPLCCAA